MDAGSEGKPKIIRTWKAPEPTLAQPPVVRTWTPQDGVTLQDIANSTLPERFSKEEITQQVLANTPEEVLCPPASAIFGVHRTADMNAVLSILADGLRNNGSNIGETVSPGSSVFDETKREEVRANNAALIAVDYDPMQRGTGLASPYAIIVRIPDGNFDAENPSPELPKYVRENIARAKANRFGRAMRRYDQKASCFLQMTPDGSGTVLPAQYISGVVDRRTGVYTPKNTFLAQHVQPSA